MVTHFQQKGWLNCKIRMFWKKSCISNRLRHLWEISWGFWVIFSGWVRQKSYFGSWTWLEVKTKTNFIELPRDLWNLSAAVQWVVHLFALLSSAPSSSAAASPSSTSMPAQQRLKLRDGNLVKWNHRKFRTMQPGSNIFKYVLWNNSV